MANGWWQRRATRRVYRKLLWSRVRTDFESFRKRNAVGFTLAVGAFGAAGWIAYEVIRGMRVDIFGPIIAGTVGVVLASVGGLLWLRFSAASAIYSEQSDEIQRLRGPKRVRLVSGPVSTDVARRAWRFHISQGQRGIDLECEALTRSVPESVECWVHDHDGNEWKGTLQRIGDKRARCCYPVDFATEAKTGRHSAEWYQGTAKQDDEGRRIVQPITVPSDLLDFRIEVEPLE